MEWQCCPCLEEHHSSHTWKETEWSLVEPTLQQDQPHSIPTSAPGMYHYTNGGGTLSTSLNSSLESHMSQLSWTMLQLAQTNQVKADHQCQNHQAMVSIQKQQTEAFNTLAAATEQRKYDNQFAVIPKFDGTNKEDCATWLS